MLTKQNYKNKFGSLNNLSYVCIFNEKEYKYDYS